jgi:basic amino acid/polyamine antiporter, APA family
LPRVLGGGSLVILGVGAIIGTGIWVLTGTAAANQAGPAVMLSFVIAGVAAALAGLCYAEFASMFPVAGSAYSYSKLALGEAAGWFMGWNLVLEYLLAAATVAVGWSAYVVSFLKSVGSPLSQPLSTAPFIQAAANSAWAWSGAFVNLPAVLVILAMTTVCCLGIRLSAVFSAIIVAIKVLVILLVIAFGIGYINVANWSPFVPPNTGHFGEFGWSGVLRGAAIVFYAYVGFDAVSTAAQEARNPEREMRLGILGSLAVCAVLYVLVAAVVTGMAPYTLLGTPAPVAAALDMHPALAWLAMLTKLGALAGMTSALLVMILAQSRILFAMASDGLLPTALCRLHPRFQTPALATVVVGVAAAAMAGLLPIGTLAEMVSIGTLLAFVIVCGGILLLRYKRPELPRPFKVPTAWLSCPVSVLVCAGMMFMLPGQTWARLGVWTALGIVLYLVVRFRRRRSLQIDSAPAGQIRAGIGK